MVRVTSLITADELKRSQAGGSWESSIRMIADNTPIFDTIVAESPFGIEQRYQQADCCSGGAFAAVPAPFEAPISHQWGKRIQQHRQPSLA